jgi:hypothetical protein
MSKKQEIVILQKKIDYEISKKTEKNSIIMSFLLCFILLLTFGFSVTSVMFSGEYPYKEAGTWLLVIFFCIFLLSFLVIGLQRTLFNQHNEEIEELLDELEEATEERQRRSLPGDAKKRKKK